MIRHRGNRVAVAVLLLAGVALFPVGYSRLFAQGAGNVENGKNVYASQRCTNCHGAQGQGGTGRIAGPQLVPTPLELPQFIKQVRQPSDQMPPFLADQVSDAALGDVYAYLKSLAGAKSSGASAPAAAPVPAKSGNADNGKKLYVAAGCYQCHSREGQGGQGSGPRLAPNPIPMAAFVRQCRQPANQMPPYTSKVLTDGDLSDIYAYLMSIPKPPDVSTIPLLKR